MNQDLDPRLSLAFAPVDKLAFGVALGTVCGLLVALATVASLVLDPERQVPLELLSEYFAGYTVDWPGVAVGAAWACFVGFVAGWFLAFARNLAVATWIFVIRARAELAATRDFMDHI